MVLYDFRGDTWIKTGLEINTVNVCISTISFDITIVELRCQYQTLEISANMSTQISLFFL